MIRRLLRGAQQGRLDGGPASSAVSGDPQIVLCAAPRPAVLRVHKVYVLDCIWQAARSHVYPGASGIY